MYFPPSKFCGRQPLKKVKGYGPLKHTWSILEYFVPDIFIHFSLAYFRPKIDITVY